MNEESCVCACVQAREKSKPFNRREKDARTMEGGGYEGRQEVTREREKENEGRVLRRERRGDGSRHL